MSSFKKLIFTTLLLLSYGFQSASAAQNNPKDVAAINEVVEAFRISIVKKDKATFVGLFYSTNPEHVTWQFVDDDIRVTRFRKFAPEGRKALRVPHSNYLTFIDEITKADAEPSEEPFRDIIIDTDGEVASVNFNYSFLLNGEEMNWGREMWQLVRTEEGWKIISVIWSQKDPLPK